MSPTRNKKTGARHINTPSAMPRSEERRVLDSDGRKAAQAMRLTPSANGPRNLSDKTSEIPRTSQEEVKKFI
jgi:hypothetical protein